MMRLDDPFPVESLPPRVRDVILDEFGRRCPSVREVASVSDAHWLQLPGIGPATLTTLRQVVQGFPEEAWSRPVSQMTDDELLDLHDQLSKELDSLQCKLSTLREKVGERRRRLRAARMELQLRRLLSRVNGSGNSWERNW